MDKRLDQQKKVKFYQTQTFRALVAIVFAAALLATSAVENADSLFGAGQERVLGAEDETAPAPSPERKAGAPEINAVINLTVSVEDGKATIRADIGDMPKSGAYLLQWQNDLSGAFEDVPGETSSSITFDASAVNMNCNWRVALTPAEEIQPR